MKIAIALMLTLTAAMAPGAETKYLTYDEFLRQVDAGQVKSVTLDHLSSITGTYMVNDEERPFSTYSDVGSSSDPLLVRELKSKNIPIEIAVREHSPSIWKNTLPIMLFMWGIPLITLILVIRISRRLTRIEKAQQGVAGYPPQGVGSPER